MKVMAPDLLKRAGAAMTQRAASRGKKNERSMARTVAVFNALTDQNLTEREGWMFMACLKAARAQAGFNIDDYIDGSAYLALAGECESANLADQAQGK
jgi:hypothetical protein